MTINQRKRLRKKRQRARAHSRRVHRRNYIAYVAAGWTRPTHVILDEMSGVDMGGGDYGYVITVDRNGVRP